jgi:hypothetical protein
MKAPATQGGPWALGRAPPSQAVIGLRTLAHIFTGRSNSTPPDSRPSRAYLCHLCRRLEWPFGSTQVNRSPPKRPLVNASMTGYLAP